MIPNWIPRPSSPWGFALALGLAPALATAQEPLPPTTPAPAPPAAPTLPGQAPAAEPLIDLRPPVPATASDPAPPGSRAVRVDTPVPVEAPAAPNPASTLPPGEIVSPGAVPAPAAGTSPTSGQNPLASQEFGMMEGKVVDLAAPADLEGSDARLVVTIDPTVTWAALHGATAADAPTIVAPGVAAPPGTTAEAPATQPEAESAIDPENPPAPDAPRTRPFTFVVTTRTTVRTSARTPEGVEVPGAATFSSPAETGLRPDPAAPRATNFTNIREGSFVAVQFRPTDRGQEAVRVTLIEPPLQTPETVPTAPTTAPAPGLTPAPTPAVAPPPGFPAPAPPGQLDVAPRVGETREPGLIPADPTAPVRSPRVPTDGAPASPAGSRP